MRCSLPREGNTALPLNRLEKLEVFLLQFAFANLADLFQKGEISLSKTEIGARQIRIGAEYLSKRLLRGVAVKAGAELFRRCWLGQTRDHKDGTSQHSRKQHASLPIFVAFRVCRIEAGVHGVRVQSARVARTHKRCGCQL